MRRMPVAALVIAGFGFVACAASPRSPVDGDDTFPREAWQPTATIEDSGWSEAGMAALEKRVAGIGSAAFMIVTRGRVVAAWGDTARTFWSHSVRKSLLSALIGQAVAEGKIDTARTLAELGIDEKNTPLTPEERRARVVAESSLTSACSRRRRVQASDAAAAETHDVIPLE